MHPKLIIFGSISTLVDTSELQREAFNAAFSSAGLDWNWSQQEYQTLLERPGGRNRVADYAKARGHQVDTNNTHAMKTEIFYTLTAERQPPLRDRVKDVVDFAQENSIPLAFAFEGAVLTTTRLAPSMFELPHEADTASA